MTLQKRRLIRDYAVSIQMCAGCLRNETPKNKRYCDVCRAKNLEQTNKYRAMPGRCSRCGNKNDRSATHKTCSKCTQPKQ